MPKDFDSDEGVIRVLHGKGDRQRTVAVDPEAASVVQLWIERRAKLGITNKSRLFSTLAGGPINPAYIRALFKRLGWRAGLDRRVHAHALRHGFATELVAEGTPINIVSMLLGHSSVSTTAIYVQHLHPKQAIDTVRQRGPWLP
jgi:site-specific recombinase XerD